MDILRQSMRKTVKLLGMKRVRITPRLAQEFIDLHPPTNAPYWPKVRRMAADMRSGRWNYRHSEGLQIMLDQDARILDGTHRMRAVVESNTAQTFIVFIMHQSDRERERIGLLATCGVAL